MYLHMCSVFLSSLVVQEMCVLTDRLLGMGRSEAAAHTMLDNGRVLMRSGRPKHWPVTCHVRSHCGSTSFSGVLLIQLRVQVTESAFLRLELYIY